MHILYYVYFGGENMILSCIFLAISVSIDSLGIGITYGIKGTRINNVAKIILFIISFIITCISINLGNIISSVFPEFVANVIGSIILVFMGFWVILQAISKNGAEEHKFSEPKFYNFFIKSLGITIQIIKNPISSDLDNSNKIDTREALYLGIALSLDSLCVGIGSSILKINSYLFPILVSSFQLIFISIGDILGRKLKSISSIPDNTWSIISGFLLILIGLIKFL